jgi:hypothetical protein
MSRPLHLCEVLEEEHAALYELEPLSRSWNVDKDHVRDAFVLSQRCKEAFGRGFSSTAVPLAGELTALVQAAEVLTDQYPGLARRLTPTLQKVIADNDDDGVAEVQHLNRLILDEIGADALEPGPRARLESYVQAVHKEGDTSALCLSGGGIRSATFSLGVIQALARRNLLDKFDFISSVSGGGYIGSWLSSWMRRHPDGSRGVAAELAQTPSNPLQPQPPPVMHLREYSNYLTPRLGVMSGDTWAVIATYVRNLLLNWAILVPAMLVLVLLPRITAAIYFATPLIDLEASTKGTRIGAAVGWIAYVARGSWLLPVSQRIFAQKEFLTSLRTYHTIGCVISGTLLLVVGLSYIGRHRPADNRYRGKTTTSDTRFVIRCLLPLIFGAVMLSAAWARYTHYFIENHLTLHYPTTAAWIIFGMPLFIWGIHLIYFFRADAAAQRTSIAAEVRFGRLRRTAKKISFEFLAALIAGYLSHHMLKFLAMSVFRNPGERPDFVRLHAPLPSPFSITSMPAFFVTLAVPLILATLYLSASIFVGLSSEVNEDWDREWWARCGGWVLAATIVWPVLSAMIIFGPLLFWYAPRVISAAGGVVSVMTIVLGRSSKTGHKHHEERSPFADLTARALAPAAIVFIFAALSLGTSEALYRYAGRVYPTLGGEGAFAWRHIQVLCGSRLPELLLALLISSLIALFAGGFIGVNKASMHALYRNRLIRAYLGASRTRRDPNPFTGFDPHDNLALHLLRPELLWLTSFADFPSFYRDLCHGNSRFIRNLRAAIDLRRHGILAADPNDESVRQALFQVMNCVLEEENFADFLAQPKSGKRTAVEAFRAAVDEVVRFVTRERVLKARHPDLLRRNRMALEKHFPCQIYPYRAPLIRRADVRDPALLATALTETVLGQKLAREMNKLDADIQFTKLSQPDELERALKALNTLLTSISISALARTDIPKPLAVPVDYRNVCSNRALLDATLFVRETGDTRVDTDGAPQSGEGVFHKMRLPRPLQMINAALNLVSGDNLAWQERKAETFTFSPLHSGSYRLGYRPTVEFGGQTGVTIGTAMTISGAAASPNMGYHSSAPLAFLMTLFNVRLGWWLGNPGVPGKRTFRRDSPLNALRPLIAEAMGKTNDTHSYVYLSDGGHFENLGLYEMVLRRRAFILVTDAGCDPDHKFDDLGNAIRKIRTDFGIPIEMDEPMYIYPRGVDEPGGKYCATGRIRYSCVDGDGVKDGQLLYIKPAVYLNEPKDIYNYAKRSNAFPHESTADQFFTESQFESYRMLGSHVIDDIVLKAIKAIRDVPRDSVAEKEQKQPTEDKLADRISTVCDAETWVPRSLQEFFDLARKFYVGERRAAAAAERKVTVQDGSRVILAIRPQPQDGPAFRAP